MAFLDKPRCRWPILGKWKAGVLALRIRRHGGVVLVRVVAVRPHTSQDGAGGAGPVREGRGEQASWEAELRRVPLLSARETEVFQLLGEGYSNRSIARRLDIAERTVKFHVAQVLSKLGVESRLQAGLVAFSGRRLYQSAVPRRMNAG
ncbi:LuxR C-terminal-related transcriptional regulator [Streptomyces sp. NPDC057302]|uniref:helix-turn-helix domain-containing protein n=1 Tax=Streptomyces sp. NPDC057302 TaxID=3346094 RepID=UPI00362CA761